MAYTDITSSRRDVTSRKSEAKETQVKKAESFNECLRKGIRGCIYHLADIKDFPLEGKEKQQVLFIIREIRNQSSIDVETVRTSNDSSLSRYLLSGVWMPGTVTRALQRLETNNSNIQKMLNLLQTRNVDTIKSLLGKEDVEAMIGSLVDMKSLWLPSKPSDIGVARPIGDSLSEPEPGQSRTEASKEQEPWLTRTEADIAPLHYSVSSTRCEIRTLKGDCSSRFDPRTRELVCYDSRKREIKDNMPSWEAWMHQAKFLERLYRREINPDTSELSAAAFGMLGIEPGSIEKMDQAEKKTMELIRNQIKLERIVSDLSTPSISPADRTSLEEQQQTLKKTIEDNWSGVAGGSQVPVVPERRTSDGRIMTRSVDNGAGMSKHCLEKMIKHAERTYPQIAKFLPEKVTIVVDETTLQGLQRLAPQVFGGEFAHTFTQPRDLEDIIADLPGIRKVTGIEVKEGKLIISHDNSDVQLMIPMDNSTRSDLEAMATKEVLLDTEIGISKEISSLLRHSFPRKEVAKIEVVGNKVTFFLRHNVDFVYSLSMAGPEKELRAGERVLDAGYELDQAQRELERVRDPESLAAWREEAQRQLGKAQDDVQNAGKEYKVDDRYIQARQLLKGAEKLSEPTKKQLKQLEQAIADMQTLGRGVDIQYKRALRQLDNAEKEFKKLSGSDNEVLGRFETAVTEAQAKLNKQEASFEQVGGWFERTDPSAQKALRKLNGLFTTEFVQREAKLTLDAVEEKNEESLDQASSSGSR